MLPGKRLSVAASTQDLPRGPSPALWRVACVQSDSPLPSLSALSALLPKLLLAALVLLCSLALWTALLGSLPPPAPANPTLGDVEAREEQEAAPAVCLVAGPVKMPDQKSMFSVVFAGAAPDRKVSSGRCVYRSPGQYSTDRLVAPVEVKESGDGTTYIYCASPKAKGETVEMVGLPCHVVGPATSAEWKSVVYHAQLQPEGVLLWVKGKEFSTEPISRFCQLACVFIQPGMEEPLKVEPISCGQEVVLCPAMWQASSASESALNQTLWMVTVEIDGQLRPSHALLDLPHQHKMLEAQLAGSLLTPGVPFKQGTGGTGPHHYACACAMVYNKKRFLEEWMVYHSKLGIEKYFVYDNGSKDKTDQMLKALAASKGIVMETRFWPWPKTHQGVQSHCGAVGRHECKWIMFNDVDEFIYPALSLDQPQAIPSATLIRRMIEIVNSKLENERKYGKGCKTVGQLAVSPLVFGPSGHKTPPKEGAVMGYTCRRNGSDPKLEKTFVLGKALRTPLMNRIHYWDDLDRKTCKVKVNESVAAFFHYKYPAWDDYKVKFQRRATTYNPDLMTTRNLTEIPALVLELKRPPDWEERFCEVEDKRLMKLVKNIFRTKEGGGHGLPWYKQ